MSHDPEENRRQTYINSINRVKAFVYSSEFKQQSVTAIEQKREFLEKAYGNFVEEHQKLVQWVPSNCFEREDNKFAQVEQIYPELIIKIRQRLSELDARAAIARQKSCEKERKKPSESAKEKESEKMSGKRNVATMEADSSSENTNEEEIETKVNRLRSVVYRVTLPQRAERDDLRHQLTHTHAHNLNSTRRDMRRCVHRRVVCYNCRGPHPMHKCVMFKARDIGSRRARVATLNLCENCFQPREALRFHRCTGGSCWRCGRFHNSLLCANAVQ